MRNDYLLNKRLLLVDDEQELLDMVVSILKEAGFCQIATAKTVHDALDLADKFQPEFAILDVMLPDGNGFSLMEKLNGGYPILFLTARGEDEDKFKGFGLGADDYIVKPFLPKELLFRIMAILRRSYKDENPLVNLHGSQIDFSRAEVIKDGMHIPLTAKEHDLLAALYRNAGRIVTIDALCEAVWGDNPFGYENSLMAHIRRIREKIEQNPSHPVSLVTIRGLGYKLIVEGDNMKNVPKLIRRFIGILMLSSMLLLLINFGAFALIMIKQSPDISVSPYNIAEETGKALQISESEYMLPEEISCKLEVHKAWAFLIDKDTLQVVWETENVPDNMPDAYTLSDIRDLAIGYLDGYPTYIGKAKNGIVVLGFPKDSFWKHTRPSWDYHFIANLPYTILKILLINIAIILLIYIMVNVKFLKPVKPIIKSIQDLSEGKPVHIHEKGLLSEISANINCTSEILQKQQMQLKRKEKARANWIAGVSHDIRTPLSMIMGYAGQLENSKNLSETEHKKAAVIIKQSNRIKNLVNDLNLASKLEYDMQPIVRKQENAVSIVRQAVVDFMNMSVDTNFPIEWKTSSNLSACYINIDKNLIKRAIANLIQNSINHNENGCIIYASVDDDENGNCMICIEDNGVGASDELIAKLNNAPHYMVCDTNTTEQRHGLGLLIVKQIISVHDGKVLIDHSKYGGFKVILIIPKTYTFNLIDPQNNILYIGGD